MKYLISLVKKIKCAESKNRYCSNYYFFNIYYYNIYIYKKYKKSF